MKSILPFLIIAFVSCKTAGKPKEIGYNGFVEKEISLVGFDKQVNLTDSLASVSFMIPARLDTFYKWHNTSDCLPCGWLQYRFADKSFPQIAENGWFPTLTDSAYQLDIWHKPIKEAPDSIILKPLLEKDTSNCFYHPHIVWISKSDSFLFKEFKLINKRPFIISAFISPRGIGKFANSQPVFVVAETNLKSRELYFIGECRAKDTTGFIDNMYKSFLSIRIKENP
jgi:hypothetical protein